MPRIKLTKSAIDALPCPPSDVVYWDACPYRKPKQLTEARESVDSSIDERSLPAQSVGVCQPYTQLTRTRSLVILLSEAGNL